MTQASTRTRFEGFLRLFAPVEEREGTTALILMANIFLILTAYYFIKPVREGWLAISVVEGFSKMEIKAYSAFAQSMLLLVIVPIYAALAARWPRRQLINRVGIAMGVLLCIFWALQPGLLMDHTPGAGIAFYLFVGIFSVTMVAQFWSLASDLYGQERGKRLFPLVAIGASAGAVVGSWIGEHLINAAWTEAHDLILLALIPLAAAIVLAAWSDRRGGSGQPSAATRARWDEPAAPDGQSPYAMISRHRYLTAIALFTLLFNWVVTSGDNILFAFVQDQLADMHAGVSDPESYRRAINDATTAFYGNLFFWVNLIGLLLQAFIVSRIIRFAGYATLLLATPAVSFAAYAAMLATPLLAVIKVMKITENATNYSVNNTARHMLWLPTTKAMMYQAKPAVDTFFVRLGDGLAALTVLLGTRVFVIDVVGFVYINLVLVTLWFAVSLYLLREHRRWSSATAPAEAIA